MTKLDKASKALETCQRGFAEKEMNLQSEIKEANKKQQMLADRTALVTFLYDPGAQKWADSATARLTIRCLCAGAGQAAKGSQR